MTLSTILFIAIGGEYLGYWPPLLTKYFPAGLTNFEIKELSKFSVLEKKIYKDLSKLKKNKGLPAEFFSHKKIQLDSQTKCNDVNGGVFKSVFSTDSASNTYMIITLMSVPEDQTTGEESTETAGTNQNVVKLKEKESDSCLISFEIFDLKTDNKLFEINRHYKPKQ